MIGFDQGRSATGEANDEKATKWRDTAHGFVKDVATYRIVDDIRTTPIGEFSDLLSKAVRVVDHMVSPHLLTHGEFFGCAGSGDDGGPKQFADVDRSQSDPSGGAVHQQDFPSFEATALQRIIGRAVAGTEGCRRLKTYGGWQRRHSLCWDNGLLGKAPWDQHTV